MNNKLVILTLVVIVLIVLGYWTYTPKNVVAPKPTESPSPTLTTTETKKEPMTGSTIDPTLFTTNINNKYFSLPVGRELTYEAKKTDGSVEKVVIKITGETKDVMGVKTLVYKDTVWDDGELVEDTLDYLAQDDMGNVWYFGEDVNNYEDGKLKDHAGSWLAGVDGAQPGIWIKASPVKGDKYKQEYYKGKAEDMSEIIATGISVQTALGNYKDCVQTSDWNPLDLSAPKEQKFYCTDVGAQVLELEANDRLELVSIK